MAVDGLNLHASNIYGQTQNREVQRSADIAQVQTAKAQEFHKMVETNFNNYAKLSPTEILNKINNARTAGASNPVNVSFSQSAMNEMRNVRSALKKQEEQVRKASVGKANLVDLMTTTTQAENYLSVMVGVRDELKNAWDKIWSMPL